MLDWSKYPNFSEREFKCHVTGKCDMRPEFMACLQRIRTGYKRPMIISSGYRDKTNPIESKKIQPGEHSFGLACDILVFGESALYLIEIAQKHNIRRIGINQKGDYKQRFIHLGMGDRFHSQFPVAIWSY